MLSKYHPTRGAIIKDHMNKNILSYDKGNLNEASSDKNYSIFPKYNNSNFKKNSEKINYDNIYDRDFQIFNTQGNIQKYNHQDETINKFQNEYLNVNY